MSSSFQDQLAFRYPCRVASCDCLICSRAGAQDKPSSYTDPASIFTQYKLVKIDPTNHKHHLELTDTDYTELSNHPSTDVNYTLHSDSTPIQHQIWYQSLLKILKNMKKDKKAGVFLHPVDPVALNIPDYTSIIKHPIDLGTISDRMDSGYYRDPDSVISDIRMVWRNAFVYNKPEHFVSQNARDMSIKFETALLGL